MAPEWQLDYPSPVAASAGLQDSPSPHIAMWDYKGAELRFPPLAILGFISVRMSDQYPRPHGVQEHRFKPITFTGGYCPGRTYRVELVEVQKADLGRKYAKKDKRPLDPPPVICCGYFEVVPSGPGGKVQERKVDPELAALGAVCHVDLFPIQLTYKGGLADVHSQSMSTTPVPVPVPATLHNGRWITPACSPEMARSTLSGSYAALRPLGVREAEQSLMASSSEECLYHSATFVRDTFNESRAATLPSLRQLAPIIGYPPTYGAPYAQVAVAPLPHTYEDTDTVAYFGDFPIQESSICTNALSGSTFTQSSVIDYNGEKVITFVFSDLSVKMEGTFVLRYRTFNLFSQCPGPTPHPILAECFGGPFEIYSTKAFPGLRPSTELTRASALSSSHPPSRAPGCQWLGPGGGTSDTPAHTAHLPLRRAREHARERAQAAQERRRSSRLHQSDERRPRQVRPNKLRPKTGMHPNRR
ncbi:velvet factor-domain-containing protein [Trametes elegans]|nr:velvet factor-domain-containing protein [Trametes elegans]